MPDPGEPKVAPLEHSSREILKGTLVPLDIPPSVRDGTNGLVKNGTIREFALAPGETDRVRLHLESPGRLATDNSQDPPVSSATLDLLRSFEDPIVASLRPGLPAVARVPIDELMSFATALIDVRTQRARAVLDNSSGTPDFGYLVQAVNAAVVAAKVLTISTAIQPIGLLSLERIEMVPAGIQRGELVATIPLAPGEHTAVTHKEWSVTSKEFTTIVTDSLEQTSETGVTDNNDLSQSTTSQNQHSNQFNITATIQGGIPIINGSSTAGATVQDATTSSATDSIKHATSMTQKAATRSRQEHKTTISTTTVTGTSETSTRTLANASTTDPIRIDYFSLMRRWRVRLYRLGVRLTYDLVVPEPGAAMRRAYAELEALQNKLGPFVFDVKYSDITTTRVSQKTGQPTSDPKEPTIERYKWLADQHNASVPPYPADPSPLTASVRADGAQEWSNLDIEFDVPVGAQIKQIYLDCNIQWDPHGGGMLFLIMGTQIWAGGALSDMGTKNISRAHMPLFDGIGSISPFRAGQTGKHKVMALLNDGQNIMVQLTVELESTAAVKDAWVNDVWKALYSAAQVNYFSTQQDIAARITALNEQLMSVDTLTLRREEGDEVMKTVLKLVLGAQFDLMPEDVRKVFIAAAVDFAHGVGFDGSTLSSLTPDQWTVLRQHEDVVRFINQAIEWENVVTFLYSYFWDAPESWAFIRNIRHHDPTRQAFLRAGAARVVLTIRKGWEDRWIRFTQDCKIHPGNPTPTTGPYLTIAQEIAAYDDRNYPGVPPANPGKSAARLQDAVYSTSSDKVGPSADPVRIRAADSTGFLVGLPVVVGVEDNGHVQEAPVITEIPDTEHIVVAQLAHAHDGNSTPFALMQPGEKGTLIAEWNEYTPSSGTDIAVTSNLATIA